MSLLQKRLLEQRMNQTDQNQAAVPKSETYARKQMWQQVKEAVLKRVAETVSPEEIEQLPASEQEKYLADQIRIIMDTVMKELKYNPARAEYHRLISELVSEVNGYGPITPLLADPEINEIMVNGPDQVYVERLGQIELTDIVFKDNSHVMHVIEKIVAPLGKRIDEASPMVDARLPDGSRINATIPPVAIDGPVLTIRKFATKALGMSDLIRAGSLTTNMAIFLKACVEGRLNIIVAGGTSSGKTTSLNVLTAFIPNHERVITIEDAAELQLQQDHVIRMEARPANIEGKGRIGIRELVINSLRMRPDRLIVGEVRGAETLDMMQAMNTGHEGSMTTAHANSPRDLLSRMETMVLMAGIDMPVKVIREQIITAIDLIVFQSRYKDGTRKITRITEVVGMEGDIVTLQDIFLFEQKGLGDKGKILGVFRPSGVLPKFMPALEAKGVNIPIKVFSETGGEVN